MRIRKFIFALAASALLSALPASAQERQKSETQVEAAVVAQAATTAENPPASAPRGAEMEAAPAPVWAISLIENVATIKEGQRWIEKLLYGVWAMLGLMAVAVGFFIRKFWRPFLSMLANEAVKRMPGMPVVAALFAVGVAVVALAG